MVTPAVNPGWENVEELAKTKSRRLWPLRKPYWSPSPGFLPTVVPDLWQVQNRFLNAYSRLAESQVMDAALRAAFAKLAAGLKVSQDLLGWRP